MPNIAAVLKTEIARIARKELRGELAPLQSASSRYRSQIAQLRKQVATLERQLKQAGKSQARPQPREGGDGAEPNHRFSAKGFAANRARLGLSAADIAKLLGVSALSVYKWESGKTRPRAAQIANIASLRGLGKREALARLSAAE